PNGQTPEGQIKKLVIQGRSLPFNDADVVPLGFNAVHSGQFVISLSQGDGIFAQGGQQVYLRDSRLNTITNISESPYSFYSASGEYNDRFELVYQPEGNLGIDSKLPYNVLIYGNNYHVHIESPVQPITEIAIFDILGRKLFHLENTQTQNKIIPTEAYGNQMLFVKVKLSNGATTVKRIINN
ncbi:MAG TPA: T9SS sorting signal type C domain-containing protein, partial [Flavobacteriaceae bacterium]|nr:T9SS sorting signal type C domain-containing protein [Flavobacteriaceae bacterium]